MDKIQKMFCKKRLGSISAVDYFSRGLMIICSSQLAAEQVVMTENSARLKLSYSSPLIQDPLLCEFGLSGEFLKSSQFFHACTSPGLDCLSPMLSLFHKTNSLVILSSLTHDQWSSHWFQETEATSSCMFVFYF